ncbi:MAG: hypothetical protein NZM00_01300, partial [Anaerolinea sp.]|nr:hypothetical protein [Anaerolinea sp.]
IGAQTASLEELWKRESATFGSTGAGSPVIVRVNPIYPANDTIDLQIPMLPHRHYSGGNVSKSEGMRPDTPFTLICQTRPAITIPPLFEQALTVWLLLGGVGKRSRRMFGSPGIRSHPIKGFADTTLTGTLGPWQSVDDLANAVRTTLSHVVSQGKNMSQIPQSPSLHPQYSWVMIGKYACDDAEEANRALFGLLRGKYKLHSENIFGRTSGGTRRASPLIAQVRRIGNAYYPVLTYFYTSDLHSHRNIINQFMKDAEKEFKGALVWGGEFK